MGLLKTLVPMENSFKMGTLHCSPSRMRCPCTPCSWFSPHAAKNYMTGTRKNIQNGGGSLASCLVEPTSQSSKGSCSTTLTPSLMRSARRMVPLTLARLVGHWKPTLFVRCFERPLKQCPLTATAGFSFGEAVNAVATWARGEELVIVANNDRKATFMPLVSRNFSARAYSDANSRSS